MDIQQQTFTKLLFVGHQLLVKHQPINAPAEYNSQ
jgi:hypothetical protein